MDQIDEKLIEILQQNARMPLKAIAAQVFLSAPAVSARIEKLEAQQLIQGYHAQIDRQKLGYHITAFISLDLETKRKPEFYGFVQACPNVLECNCVTGEYSMLIKVAFPSTQELDTLSVSCRGLARLRRRLSSQRRCRREVFQSSPKTECVSKETKTAKNFLAVFQT